MHLGHLVMAQDAMESCELNKVLFVPCAKPPHKEVSVVASPHHRLAMLKAAIEGSVRFEVCDIELLRGGTSYTVDTVDALAEKYCGAELVFIIGSDSLFELHAWKNIYSLLESCRVVTVARPGFDPASISRPDIKLKDPWPDRLLNDVINVHQMNIASSDIRHRIAEGFSVSYLVPQAVEMYIAEHRLYCTC